MPQCQLFSVYSYTFMLRLLAFYVTAIVFLSLNPWLKPANSSAMGFLTWDMIAHASAYSVLSGMLLLTFINKGRALTITLLVILVCGFSGVFMEFCQYWFTASRQMSLHDAVSNFFGAILGAAGFWSARILIANDQQHYNT